MCDTSVIPPGWWWCVPCDGYAWYDNCSWSRDTTGRVLRSTIMVVWEVEIMFKFFSVNVKTCKNIFVLQTNWSKGFSFWVQVAGRTTFCHIFFINTYAIGSLKLPVAGPKNMYNLYYSHLKMTTPCYSKGRFHITEIISINIKCSWDLFSVLTFSWLNWSLLDTCYKVYDVFGAQIQGNMYKTLPLRRSASQMGEYL